MQWIQVTLRIFGTFDAQAATKLLDIEPTKSFVKGDFCIPGNKKSARNQSDGWLLDFECDDQKTAIENLGSFLQLLSKKQQELTMLLKQGDMRGDLYVGIGGEEISSLTLPPAILKEMSTLSLGLVLNFYL